MTDRGDKLHFAHGLRTEIDVNDCGGGRRVAYLGYRACGLCDHRLTQVPLQCGVYARDLRRRGIGAAMIPLAIATNFLGVWMLKRVPHDAFYRIAYVLMLALGVMLVRSAIVDMGWI